MHRPSQPQHRPTFTRPLALAALAAALQPPASLRAPPGWPDPQRGRLLQHPGFEVLAFSNTYDGNFSDSKIAGVELIHHGVRTASNGDVRLSPTPEQWDIVATPVDRKVDAASGTVTTRMRFDTENFEYAVKVSPARAGVAIQVLLDKPLPVGLAGKAGFNLEFLPSAYFGKSWMSDAGTGALPLYPSGPSRRDNAGATVRLPLASGHALTLAPEDPTRRVAIRSAKATLGLYDGRNNAQNGWYVVRSLLPGGKTGTVLEWTVEGSTVPGWTRPTVIGHSQVGYHPAQRKVAILERDRNAPAPGQARLLRVAADGSTTEVQATVPQRWGQYLRYDYYTFDFSAVRKPGLYL